MSLLDFEIVEFYPISQTPRDLIGTLKIRWAHLGLTVQGIYVRRQNSLWYMSFPWQRGYNDAKKKYEHYTTLMIDDVDERKAWIAALKETAIPYIEDRLADVENPLVFPPPLAKKVFVDRKKKEAAPSEQESEAKVVAVKEKPERVYFTPPPLPDRHKARKARPKS